MTLASASSDVGRSDRKGRMLLVKLTLVLLLTPLTFNIGSLFMTPARALFLLMVPVLLPQLFIGRFGRVLLMDWLLFVYILWIAIAIGLNNPASFVTFVGSNAALFLGGYLVGRACIRNAGDFREFSRFMGLCIVILLPFALYENRTNDPILQTLIAKLPGFGSYPRVIAGQRLGLNRAQVVFAHPIHWGLFASLGFAMVLTGMRTVTPAAIRMIWAALIGLACFTSISAGPLLALSWQVVLLAYWMLFRRFRQLWLWLMVSSATLYMVLEVLSSRPAYLAIATRLTFNPSSAYYRNTQLEYGLAQIAKTPLFGIGFNDWDRPIWLNDSIDNFWLLNALVYGIPALACLVGIYLYSMIGAARRPFPEGSLLRDQRRAWTMTLTSLILTLTTVAVWGEITVIMFLVIGAGAFFLTAPAPGTGGTETEPVTTGRSAFEHARPAAAGARQFTRFGPAGRGAVPPPRDSP